MSPIMRCVILFFANSFAEIHNKAWWNNTVFYQIYPRSLYDSDADGVGDLKGEYKMFVIFIVMHY